LHSGKGKGKSKDSSQALAVSFLPFAFPLFGDDFNFGASYAILRSLLAPWI